MTGRNSVPFFAGLAAGLLAIIVFVTVGCSGNDDAPEATPTPVHGGLSGGVLATFGFEGPDETFKVWGDQPPDHPATAGHESRQERRDHPQRPNPGSPR